MAEKLTKQQEQAAKLRGVIDTRSTQIEALHRELGDGDEMALEQRITTLKQERDHLKRQLDAGITSIVLAGTTGESPTLSDSEKLTLFRRAKAYVGSDAKIILTGISMGAATVLMAAGKDVAYDEIMDAVSDFDMVNAKLAAILTKLTVEEF